jgi:hypothetical protein
MTRSVLLIAALAAAAAVATHACAPSASSGSAPPDAGAAALVLAGVYAVQPESDAGDAGDPLTALGDVLRFEGDRYSVHRVPCPASAAPVGDAAVPDSSIPDGCTSTGTFALSADGSTLSMTDDATGTTTTTPFQVLAADPIGLDGGSAVGLSTPVHTLGGGTSGGDSSVSLTGPSVSLTSGRVTLYRAGTVLVGAFPCSGESSKLGADTGAMIRTATATSYTCIESRITFPAFDVPTGPSGQSYCTSFGQAGCTAANYYGRRGVPFLYFTFVAGGRAECGFEYQPGLASGAAQGNPRWTPYIRDTAGAYVYGVASDEHAGETHTVWCGIESDGLVRMKIDGAFVAMAGAGGTTTPLSSKLSFHGAAVHAFRVTGLAWPETAPQNVAAAKKARTFFPAYTCQPMNQLGPVVYQHTLLCPGTSTTPSVPYVTAAGGNARWSAGGDGYTLSPASEVSETESGTTDTDLIFPGGS